MCGSSKIIQLTSLLSPFIFSADIFLPLFEVTVNPAVDPKLHAFLQSCIGFDMVCFFFFRFHLYSCLSVVAPSTKEGRVCFFAELLSRSFSCICVCVCVICFSLLVLGGRWVPARAALQRLVADSRPVGIRIRSGSPNKNHTFFSKAQAKWLAPPRAREEYSCSHFLPLVHSPLLSPPFAPSLAPSLPRSPY